MIPQVGTNEAAMVNHSQTGHPQPTHQMEGSLKKRLKAEVKVLAAIQIMCGVVVLSLGIILACFPPAQHLTSVFSVLLKSGYPFVGALFFIICGILSIITETKSTKELVDGSLIMNILSASFAFIGIIIVIVNLAALHPASDQCNPTNEFIPLFPITYHQECSAVKVVLTGALSLMLICSVLEFGLAVLSAILWWKQHHSDFVQNVLFLFHN